jgi:putative tricarboxylic transport membrane protein
MMVSGVVGYLLRKFGYEMAPLLLAIVLGDRLEENFRLSLTLSGGSYATFVQDAALVVLIVASGVLLLVRTLAWSIGYRRFLDQ